MVRKEKATQGRWKYKISYWIIQPGMQCIPGQGKDTKTWQAYPLAVAAILEHRCMVRKIVEAGEILESSLLMVTGTPKPLWLGTARHFAIEVGNLGSVKDIAMTATRTNIDEVSTGGKPSGKTFPVEKVKPVANMGEATRLELKLEKAMWNSPWLPAEILKNIGITK